MVVTPVLCLHYCQCSVLCVVFALLPVQCAVCVSPVLCLLNILQAQFAMRGLRQVLLLLFYLLFFALLPAHCAVRVSPVLCLHYCQRSVLCVYVSPVLCLQYCQHIVLCV